MAGFSWKSDTLFQNFDADKIMQGAYMKAINESKRIKGHMQANRPWTDRTGEAKRKLSVTTEKTAKKITIVMQQGVEYGIFLEMRWNQRYAIIKPTLTRQAPLVMQSMYGLLNRL